jgi:hypothetical protein
MWWIPRGLCILDSKSLKVSSNVLGLEDFLTFGCWIILWPSPYCTDRELFWIKELGTAMPYGCNDSIKGMGNLSSSGCSEINVMRADWNDYTKSCIWDLLHHIDVGSFYFVMLDEFHQHTKVHRMYIRQVLDAAKSTWWAFIILFQELNVAMVIK